MEELLNLSKQLMKLRVFKSTITVESSLLSYYKHEVEQYIKVDTQGLVEVLFDQEGCLTLRVYNVKLLMKTD